MKKVEITFHCNKGVKHFTFKTDTLNLYHEDNGFDTFYNICLRELKHYCEGLKLVLQDNPIKNISIY